MALGLTAMESLLIQPDEGGVLQAGQAVLTVPAGALRTPEVVEMRQYATIPGDSAFPTTSQVETAVAVGDITVRLLLFFLRFLFTVQPNVTLVSSSSFFCRDLTHVASR